MHLPLSVRDGGAVADSPPLREPVLAVGQLRLRLSRYDLQWGTQVVPLTRQACVLLACLLATPGEVVPTPVLQAALWGDGPVPPNNSLQVLIMRLRRTLTHLQYEGAITTVREHGYRFDPARSEPARSAPRPLRGRATLRVQSEPPYTLRAGARSVRLTPCEARILALLRQEAGHVVADARLLAAGSGEAPVSRNNLQAYIGRLRRRLQAVDSPWRIRTYRTWGYALDPPAG
jgi:DNA-binding response OmpR family regulator